MSRELNGEINADNTFKEWTVTNLLSSPAVAETHPKIHVKLAPHLRKVSLIARNEWIIRSQVSHDYICDERILSTASGSRLRCNPDGLCERGHFKGAAEAVAEIGEGAYAQLLRCLHQRCEDVHRTGASLATAV